MQLIRFGDLAVEWIDAAWKQDARTTTERKSDFHESALRTCEEIVKESKLSEQQVAQVKKYAFKWKLYCEFDHSNTLTTRATNQQSYSS